MILPSTVLPSPQLNDSSTANKYSPLPLSLPRLAAVHRPWAGETGGTSRGEGPPRRGSEVMVGTVMEVVSYRLVVGVGLMVVSRNSMLVPGWFSQSESVRKEV